MVLMSRTWRRTSFVILVVMLGLALFGLVLVGLGRGSWTLVGGALVVAVGALVPLVTLDPAGQRVAVMQRGRVVVVGLALAAAASLVTAGVTGRSAFTWVIVVLFLVGLVLTLAGVVQQARQPRDGQQDA